MILFFLLLEKKKKMCCVSCVAPLIRFLFPRWHLSEGARLSEHFENEARGVE